MSSQSLSTKSRACSQCRCKKVHCSRDTPICKACAQAHINCTYPSTTARYTVSRARACTECQRQRSKCDRARPCGSCLMNGTHCVYTNSEKSVANSAGNIAAADPELNNSGYESSRALNASVLDGIPIPNSGYPSMILGSDSFPADVSLLHPSPPQIWLLWITYLENVDPLYKIFHASSFEKQLLQSVQDLQTVHPDVETMLFAVYFAGVASLTDEECLSRFHEAKVVKLKRYRYALEQCLTRSMFFASPRLITLQAFVLYITVAQNAPIGVPADALLALAICLARKLSIHQDDARNQMQPLTFTTVADYTNLQMRRRLWWHILILDVQLAESGCTDPTILEGSWNAKSPGNMDDVELDAYSQLPLPPRPGEMFDPDTYAIKDTLDNTTASTDQGRRTDMSYALTRIEIFRAFRHLNFSEQFCKNNGYEHLATSTSQIQFLDDLIREIHRKHLQHCNRNDPLSFFIRNVAKVTISKHLMLAKRGGSTRESLHNCTKVLEASVGLRRTHARWAWSLRSYLELDVLVVLLPYLTEVLAELVRGDSKFDAEVRHSWLLSQQVVHRGREHGLELCYTAQWATIEGLWKRIEEMESLD